MRIKVFADTDPDGACSAFLIKEIYKTFDVDIVEVTEKTLPTLLKTWRSADYAKTYFLDLRASFLPVEEIDFDNTVIIDHHNTATKQKAKFKNAKCILDEYSSCCKLIYDKFNTKLSLSEDQKKLIEIIDDYDSYELKFSDSLKINAIFASYKEPKIAQFIESWCSGFRDYTLQEQQTIKLFFKKLKDKLDALQCFEGIIKSYKVVSFINDYAINEVCQFVLKKYNADIVINVTPSSNTVILRKNKNTCKINLGQLAEILCSGSGEEHVAFGDITDIFLNFTKTLKPCFTQKT